MLGGAGVMATDLMQPASLSDGVAEIVVARRRPELVRFSGLFVWAAFIAVFSIWVPQTFLTRATWTSIAGDQAVTLILAIGLLVALAAGQFDLSAAQNLGASAVLCGVLMSRHGVPWVIAVLLTLLFGALVGFVNGTLVRLGVDSFISTLGMGSVLIAVTSLISDNQFIGPLSKSFQSVVRHRPFGIPIITVYALVIAAIAWYVLEHSPIGRRLYATGANPDASRLAGVRTGRFVLGSLVVSGVMSSLAGVLVAARIGSVSPTLGPSYLLPAFAACFLGATQIKVGRFNVWGAVIAIYLLATGVKGLQLAGGQLWVTDMFNGVALIGAVSIAVLGAKRRDARLKAETARG